MPDRRLTQLPVLAALSADDIFYVVDDPAGAANSRQVAASVFDARYLQTANNLSDLTNAVIARASLGLGSLAVVNDAPADGSFYGRQNNAWVAAATLPVVDETALVYQTGQAARTLTFDLVNYTAARVVTWPDAALFVAGQDYANIFTLAQTIKYASGLDGATPVKLTLNTSSDGTWTDQAIWAQLIFSSDDASGSGPGPRAAVAAYVNGTTGQSTGLDFFTSTAGGGGGALTRTLRVAPSGFVGIYSSTSAPAARLDVGDFGALVNIASSRAAVCIADSYPGISGVQMYNANTGTAGDFRFIVADDQKDQYIAFSMPGTGNTSTLFGITRNTLTALFVNSVGAGTDRILAIGTIHNTDMFFGTNNLERIRITNAGRVGIGESVPTGKLHVEQSSATGAIPSLWLRQADLSEEFIRFETTVGAGDPIDTAALGAYYGKVRVYVEGVGAKWLALYD